MFGTVKLRCVSSEPTPNDVICVEPKRTRVCERGEKFWPSSVTRSPTCRSVVGMRVFSTGAPGLDGEPVSPPASRASTRCSRSSIAASIAFQSSERMRSPGLACGSWIGVVIDSSSDGQGVVREVPVREIELRVPGGRDEAVGEQDVWPAEACAGEGGVAVLAYLVQPDELAGREVDRLEPERRAKQRLGAGAFDDERPARRQPAEEGRRVESIDE